MNPSKIRTRPAQPHDQIPDGLPPAQPDSDTPVWRRSLVGLVGDDIVATASLSLSPLTDTYFCEVTVTPDYRRRGIGTRLYHEAYALTNGRFPVVARAMASRPERRAFAEALGCAVLAHCPEPWIDPTTGAVRQWITAQQLPAGHITTPMSTQSSAAVVTAWTQYFAWAHRPFGAVHVERLPPVWEGYAKGLDEAVSMITLDRDEHVAAFSLVAPDAWDGRTMIVSECVHPRQPDGADVLAATVAASLAVLAERDVHRVELEGHSTDAHSPGLVASIPHSGGDPMDILTLTPPSNGEQRPR